MLEIRRQADPKPTLVIRPATKIELLTYENAIRNISEDTMIKHNQKELCFKLSNTIDTSKASSEFLFTRGN